jgi:copper chaperone CopZ
MARKFPHRALVAGALLVVAAGPAYSDAPREGVPAKSAEGGARRLTLEVSPVNDEAAGARLRALIGGHEGVQDVRLDRSFPPGTVRVTITGKGANAEKLVPALRSGGFEARTKDSYRKPPPPRDNGKKASDLKRFVFLAGPVRNDQDAAQLRATLQQVPGVQEVTIRPAEQAGTARVTAAGIAPISSEALLRAGRGIGAQMRLLEQGNVDKQPLRDGEPKKDGDQPLKDGENPLKVGDKPFKDGEKRPDGEKPLRDGEKRPDAELKPTGSKLTFLAGPIRNDQDAARLRAALQRVPGVREVGLRPSERQGVGIVTVSGNGQVAVETLVRAARGLGVDMRPMDRGDQKPK